jgi:hypothetical protein
LVEGTRSGAGQPGPSADVFAQVPPPGTAKVLGNRVRVTHEGTALIPVRCLGAAGARCADRLTVRAARAYPGLGITRGKLLGGGRYRLPAGTTKQVGVRLGAAGRSVLVRFGRLLVRIELGATDEPGARAPAIELLGLPSPSVIVDNTRATVFADGHLKLHAYCDTDRPLRCRASLTISDERERTLAARQLVLSGERHQTVTLRSPALARLAHRGVDITAFATTVSTSPAGWETVRRRVVALLPAGDHGAGRRLARRVSLPAASPSAPRTLRR